MIPEKLMSRFRMNSGNTAIGYARSFCTFPDKNTIRSIALHYIMEANIKISYLEDIVMPAKRNQSNFGSTKFCAISLDTAQKDTARKWLEKHGKDLDTYAVEMVRDGWKASFSWDDYNDCFIASSTCRDDKSVNYDVCVTSRSDNMWDAMLLNYFKIYVMFKDAALPTEKEKQNWG